MNAEYMKRRVLERAARSLNAEVNGCLDGIAGSYCPDSDNPLCDFLENWPKYAAGFQGQNEVAEKIEKWYIRCKDKVNSRLGRRRMRYLRAEFGRDFPLERLEEMIKNVEESGIDYYDGDFMPDRDKKLKRIFEEYDRARI